MVDTSLETIKKLFFDQIKSLSRKGYLEWKRYKYGIELLENLHLHSVPVKLETYK